MGELSIFCGRGVERGWFAGGSWVRDGGGAGAFREEEGVGDRQNVWFYGLTLLVKQAKAGF